MHASGDVQPVETRVVSGSRCPLCDAPASFLFRKDGAPFYQCSACRFRFCRPERNANLDNELAEFEPAYLDYLDLTPEDPANLGSQQRWIERHLSLAEARVLDVGAGSGKWVRHLRAAGVTATGVEPNRALFDRFLAEPDFFQGTLEEFVIARPGERFDVVTAFDVIEHVPDPAAVLEAASALLEPGGWLFLSTPDARSLPARLLGRRWHYYHRYHLSYLDHAQLKTISRPRGFQLLRWGRHGRYHSVGFILDYVLQILAGRFGAQVPRRLQRWVVPVNLFDVLYAVLRREETESIERSEPISANSTSS